MACDTKNIEPYDRYETCFNVTLEEQARYDAKWAIKNKSNRILRFFDWTTGFMCIVLVLVVAVVFASLLGIVAVSLFTELFCG